MRDGLYLVPGPLPHSPLEDRLVPGPVWEDEDEDSVSLAVVPAAVQDVPVGKSLISRPVLLASPPAPCEDVSVSEVVGSLSVSLVRHEEADVLVSPAGALRPPELAVSLLTQTQSRPVASTHYSSLPTF